MLWENFSEQSGRYTEKTGLGKSSGSTVILCCCSSFVGVEDAFEEQEETLPNLLFLPAYIDS